jgi:tetratricopeptide (TPR) repeat protein
MIKNFNNKKNRVCLGLVLSVCLLAHGKSSASGSSELDDATRNRNNIAGGQGTMSGNNITGTVEQTYNKGGEGGKVEIRNEAQRVPKTPAESYSHGMAYLDETPPREREALLAFREAAGAVHDAQTLACVECAGCYSRQNPPNVEKALEYYDMALSSVSTHIPQSAYSGLMKLYYNQALTMDEYREDQIEQLEKALEYGGKLKIRNPEMAGIFREIRRKLSQLQEGSEVYSMVNTLKKPSIIVGDEPQQKLQCEPTPLCPSAFSSVHNKKANRILEAKAEAERIIAEAEEEAEYNRTISEAKIKAEEIKTKAKTKIIFDDKVSSETKTIIRSYPAIARGYEAIYDRFMNGRLVYKGPAGERSFLISDIANSSLEGEFNLNGLTFTSGSTTYNISDYLRIKLGYRKVKENEDKTTAWIVPQFVSRAGDSSFNAVQWTSDVGIFWTWGQYGLTDFDYLTSMQFDEISTKNLYDLRGGAVRAQRSVVGLCCGGVRGGVSFIFN